MLFGAVLDSWRIQSNYRIKVAVAQRRFARLIYRLIGPAVKIKGAESVHLFALCEFQDLDYIGPPFFLDRYHYLEQRALISFSEWATTWMSLSGIFGSLHHEI
jgi:hypothetical protein